MFLILHPLIPTHCFLHDPAVPLPKITPSIYDLEIEIGRHNRIDRNNRICKLCNSNAIETEFHFVMVCPLYKDLRRKYIPFSSWPTVNRFIRYMALSNKVMLLKIAHFLENAFKIRSEKIANMNI